MPGLCLTKSQVQRLCGVDAATSTSALRALVSSGFLGAPSDGRYRRSESAGGSVGIPTSSTTGPHPPWRRLLCLVDVASDTGGALAAASHSAVRYATTLAVTHRARVTTLVVMPRLAATESSSGDVEQISDEQRTVLAKVAAQLRKSVAGETLRGLIDIQVTIGSWKDELLRVAAEVRADLIVLGRGDQARMLSLPQLREVLWQAPCPVLIVHPSGHAAVA